MAISNDIIFTVTAAGFEEAEAKMNKFGATIQRFKQNANGSVTASGKLTSTLDEQAKATGRASNAIDEASNSHKNYIAHIAKTTILSAGVNKAFLGLVDAAGKAVKQVDLLQNFPAAMQSLGSSGNDASVALKTLRGYVAGVGGDLTQAATSVTRFTEVTKNVKASVAEFAGVNNALIAGAAPAEVQKNALEQLTQAYSRGKPQLIEWRSLMVAMPAQLTAVAKAMGQPNAQALGEQLTNGKITMQDFLTTLTQLSTGVGPIAKQAQLRMTGIQFASNQMSAALTNGLTAIFQAVGRENIVSFLTFLTEVIGVLTRGVVTLINDLISLANWISAAFGGGQIAHFTGDSQKAADALGTGAANAGDMADGLGDAADNAAKINKSLASFDKMNVLPDKTSGAASDTSGIGQNGLDAATASKLDAIFGDIGGKLKDASNWAKALAGFLAGLVGIKFAQAIIDQIDGITKSFGKAITAGGKFKTFLLGNDDKKNVISRTSDSVRNLAAGLAGLATSGLANLSVFTNPWVLLALAIAAVVAGIIYLFNTNEDFRKGFLAAWNGFTDAVKNTGEFIKTSFGKVLSDLKNTINGLPGPFKTAFNEIGKVVQKVGNFFEDLAKKIGITGTPMQVLGKAAGGLAVAVAVLAAAFAIYELVMIGVTIATTAFGIVMAIITSPITLIILAIVALVAIIYILIHNFDTIAVIAGEAWNAIVGVWQGVAKWFMDNVVQPVLDFFTGLWTDIKNVFSEAVAWFGKIFSDAWNAVVAIWDGVADWFNTRWQNLKTNLGDIATWFGKIFQDAWNSITAIFGALEGFFKTRWDNLKSNLGDVASWFAGVFQDAWNRITTIFSGLWSWFKTNVWDKIVSVFTSIGTTVADGITGAVKGVINTLLTGVGTIINGFIGSINGAINTIDKLPGVNIKTISKFTVPQLAKGGVVSQPTLAMMGEAGSEAVMPLENNTEWIDKLASRINTSMSGGQPMSLTVQIGEDKIVNKVISLINEKTQMGGRNTILV